MPVLIGLAALVVVASFLKMHPKDQNKVLGVPTKGDE